MNELMIKKIKNLPKEQKIKIAYMLDGDEIVGTFSEPAKPSFYDCFKALVEPVIDILELPQGFEKRIEPFGVTYSHGDDAMRASITVRLHMPASDTVTVVNTPVRKVSIEYEDGLKVDACNTLMKLEDEAKEYLNGHRAQTNLFEQADEETHTLKVVGA